MKQYIKCLVCGDLIPIDTKNIYTSCKCGKIAVDGCKHYWRVIGGFENWEQVEREDNEK